MDILILAGGLGTRLRSIVNDRPKVLADINGRPFLDYQIAMLRRQTQSKIILCTGYLSSQVEDYVNKSRLMDVFCSKEETSLGTAGAIRNALKFIDSEELMVVNGDTYIEPDVSDFLNFYNSNEKIKVAVLLKNECDCSRYGSVILSNNGMITGFGEKEGSDGEGLINIGAYIINRSIVSDIPLGFKCSLETDIFPHVAKDGNMFGKIYSGYFIDIGIEEAYVSFIEHISKSDGGYYGNKK